MNYFTQKKFFLFFYLLMLIQILSAQGFKKGDILVCGSVGATHLDKIAMKTNTQREEFKSSFKGSVEIQSVKGTNPLAFKYEYALSKYFGLGVSIAWFSIIIDVKDTYYDTRNSQNQRFETDLYTFKISSSSFGVRPNFHIPVKHTNSDFFIGCAVGITKNQLSVNFSSTAYNSLKVFYELNFPGKIYLAPTFGYRVFLSNSFGFNFEVGYEKGALMQGGVTFRFRSVKLEMPK